MFTPNEHVSKYDVLNTIEYLGLYRPSFMEEILEDIESTDSLDRVFVYINKETHQYLYQYHAHWETLLWILLHNAQDEEKGGSRVFVRMNELLESEIYKEKYSQLIKSMDRHYKDEIRHGKFFMKAANIAAEEFGTKIVDNPDTSVGNDIAENLMIKVPMPLFDLMSAIFSIELRSYVMIVNTIKHINKLSKNNVVFDKIIECINSIPSDEAYHVLYTAKYLEEELDTDMNKRKSRIKIISDSMKHAGNEMCDHINSHEQSVINQGGITALSKI